MDNHHHPLPDSRHSSPHSPDTTDLDNNPSMDDPPLPFTATKVKLMCSYGGNIQFRTHDNQLAYVGGDTKIITVDRTIKISAIMAKLSSLCNAAEVFVKYQIPGEGLDALISVTNDEDLEHMMVEYDLSQRPSVKPSRLRLFLFPPKPSSSSPTSFDSNELKPEQQWFVDALNSVHLPRHHVKSSSKSSPIPAANPDFLSGLDYRYSVVSATKLPDPVNHPSSTVIPRHVAANDSPTETDGRSENQIAAGEPLVSPTDQIQTQIDNNGLQILQNICENNKKLDYSVKNPETNEIPEVHKIFPPPITIPRSATIYSPERLLAGGGYSLPASATVTEPPLYFIATPAVMYHATTVRAVTGTVGHHHHHNQQYYRVPAKVEVATEAASGGYAPVVYEDATGGRQVFIAAAPAAWGAVAPPHREVAAGGDVAQCGGGGNLN